MTSARGETDAAPNGVTIHPSTRADAPFIGDLTARFADAGILPWRDATLLSRFFERAIGEIAELVEAEAVNPREAILPATDNTGTRLGFTHLRLDLSALTKDRQGYGKALAAGESWARGQGFRFLTLDTFGTNNRARAFYNRLCYAEETLKCVKSL